jgi:hypothetical protein
MAIPDFIGYSVLSITFDEPTGEVYTVLPVGDIKVKVIPYIPAGSKVIDLINGTRINSFSENSYHVDIEIKWKEIGDVKWPALVAFVKSAFANPTRVVKFYPVSNSARTAPDGVNAGVPVIVQFDQDVIELVWGDKIRERSGSLILKGAAPIAAASLPAWTSV